VAELIQKIQKESKIGTAFERYDSQHLWDLGEQLRLYSDFAADRKDIVAEIIACLETRSIKCLPLLLKNAETARRAWPIREQFLEVANDVSYGKLKAVLPIFDPDFVSQAKVSQQDLEGLGRMLARSTYEEVLEQARKLRGKYDPRGVSIDFDEFYQELYSATQKMRQLVEKQVKEGLKEFRQKFTPNFIEDSRRLMAAMRSEEMFAKLASKLPEKFGQGLDTKAENLEGHLFRVVHGLSRIRQAPAALREKLRERIGIARLGELSTLIKAASSDDELERYLRGQKLLQQLRVTGIKEG